MGPELTRPDQPMNGQLQILGSASGQFVRSDYAPKVKIGDFYVFPYDVRHVVYPFANKKEKRRQMKNFISIIVIMLAVGCGKSLTEEEKKVVGSYETKKDENGIASKLVLLENRKAELFLGGNKAGTEAAWKLFEKEVHTLEDGENTFVHKIEPNGDLTLIAAIIDENRTELPKELKLTLKKFNLIILKILQL